MYSYCSYRVTLEEVEEEAEGKISSFSWPLGRHG